MSLLYHIYMFIFWRVEAVIYDGRILFLFGVIPWIQLYINSVLEFFLCTERCLTVVFPLSYDKHLKFTYSIFAAIGIGISSAAVIFLCDLPWLYPISGITLCRFFGCYVQTGNPFITYLKLIFATLCIVAAITLATLIKGMITNNSHNNHTAKRMNKTVLFMVICTIIIEFVPFAIAQVFLMMTGKALQEFTGPYGYTGSTINIALSAGIYYNAFKKNFTGTTVAATNS